MTTTLTCASSFTAYKPVGGQDAGDLLDCSCCGLPLPGIALGIDSKLSPSGPIKAPLLRLCVPCVQRHGNDAVVKACTRWMELNAADGDFEGVDIWREARDLVQAQPIPIPADLGAFFMEHATRVQA